MIDTPGPMETGRLYDIDGDGKLDILPNGTDFAAWYELVQDKAADGKIAPKFVKHDLPKEIAGHGVGFGDINGDGRGDIVGPHGLARSAGRPPRRPLASGIPIGNCTATPAFRSSFTTSMATATTTSSGAAATATACIGWSKTSNASPAGASEDAAATWTRHAIDTSWAQPHSIFLADLDGDKQLELVAGKRYMGHEGKDPGEYDLLCAYSYTFDPKPETWQRTQDSSRPSGRLWPRSQGGRHRRRRRSRSGRRRSHAAWCCSRTNSGT